MTAEPVTLKAVPALAEAGLETETLETLMSEEARTLVVAPLAEPELLPGVGSETWSWSMAAEAAREKLWAEGLVQVTDQVLPPVGTVVAVEVAREVSWTTLGLAEEVVQSEGRVRVSVVSTLVGP